MLLTGTGKKLFLANDIVTIKVDPVSTEKKRIVGGKSMLNKIVIDI